ncbi:MAG: hypothetical protein Q8O81_16315 [Giesbergeria sp.]|nr:hypothetical protein [Giesbergeria sp.]
MTASFLFRNCKAIGGIVLLTIATAGVACAQSPAAAGVLTEFPADTQPLNRKAIEERLSGQVYTGTNAAGIQWRAEYKDSGYVFLNIANGARDSGTWRAEEGRVCIEYRGTFPSGCSELRANSEALYAKRDNSAAVIVMRKQ